ncbi:MAG TPA: DUF1294 domain-containing protein [Candidatus Eubacterium faecavium]|nr:DUF1294 domain-containing protein [Candidatus Eubacterium faecavium]
MKWQTAIPVYLLLINIISAVFTAADKYKAKRGRFRISEDLLLTLAFIGGAAAEYITMKIIRHKTKHKKFMIGLPAIMILHAAAAILVLYILKL